MAGCDDDGKQHSCILTRGGGFLELLKKCQLPEIDFTPWIG
jgi:hypothetical protein